MTPLAQFLAILSGAGNGPLSGSGDGPFVPAESEGADGLFAALLQSFDATNGTLSGQGTGLGAGTPGEATARTLDGNATGKPLYGPPVNTDLETQVLAEIPPGSSEGPTSEALAALLASVSEDGAGMEAPSPDAPLGPADEAARLLAALAATIESNEQAGLASRPGVDAPAALDMLASMQAKVPTASSGATETSSPTAHAVDVEPPGLVRIGTAVPGTPVSGPQQPASAPAPAGAQHGASSAALPSQPPEPMTPPRSTPHSQGSVGQPAEATVPSATGDRSAAPPTAQMSAAPPASGDTGAAQAAEDAPRQAATVAALHAASGRTLIQLKPAAATEPTAAGSPDHGAPPLQLRAQAHPTAQAPIAQSAPPAPVHSLAVQIAQSAHNGLKRFDIRLDPPDLGRVDVRLEVNRAGQVTTHLVVERAETLDMLQRDARSLERALQQAGLDTAKDGLSFSLKDQGLARRQDRDAHAGADKADGGDETEEPDRIAPPEAPSRYSVHAGLDIRI